MKGVIIMKLKISALDLFKKQYSVEIIEREINKKYCYRTYSIEHGAISMIIDTQLKNNNKVLVAKISWFNRSSTIKSKEFDCDLNSFYTACEWLDIERRKMIESLL